ncbi:MAG TPA: thermonuclease family protein [Allosphingosinicella sp.]|nr:thermonuclease family protein [Allosphingosinicella sp.]
MSRHWSPPPRRARTSSRKIGFSWSEIRLTVLGGVFLGLAYVFVPSGGGASGEAASGGAASGGAAYAAGADRVTDPWAASIVDGDTFRYRGEKYRIADIDTPEVNGRCAFESELAARATDRMEALLHQGPFELHGVDRDEDRYGRKLRVVTRDGRSLGDQLVAEGLARTWTGRREPWC